MGLFSLFKLKMSSLGLNQTKLEGKEKPNGSLFLFGFLSKLHTHKNLPVCSYGLFYVVKQSGNYLHPAFQIYVVKFSTNQY